MYNKKMEVRGWWDDKRIELAVASDELEGRYPNQDNKQISAGVPWLRK